MFRKRSLLLFHLLLFLSACQPPGAVPIAASRLTRQQAIDAALKIASGSAPEVSGALVPPANIQAQRMTLAEAMQRMFGNSEVPRGFAPDLPVWYITMEGLWASEVSAPGVTATQQPYHHYIVVLDAETGMEIEGSLRP